MTCRNVRKLEFPKDMNVHECYLLHTATNEVIVHAWKVVRRHPDDSCCGKYSTFLNPPDEV